MKRVLYFCSNTKNNYYQLYEKLSEKFNTTDNYTTDDIDQFLDDNDSDKWYIKELPYQFEIYNIESEYVFCINKLN